MRGSALRRGRGAGGPALLRQDGGVTAAASSPAPRRVDGSMSLLVDMMTNTLDEAYAERARRVPAPRGDVQEPAPRARRAVTALALVAVGLVSTAAVTQVRGQDDSGVRGRLAAEALDRTAQSEALDGRAEALRAELPRLREAALGADAVGRSLAERLTALELASATTAVVGPGVVVTLDDAAPSEDRQAPANEDGRVRDTDLQDTVNALWAAGAEAMSINGQRLTALTAKRSAGAAVLVDLLPLSPPYVVRAVGPAAGLELGLLDGEVGSRLMTYGELYGLRLDVRRERELRLAGAADPDLRSATPVEVGAAQDPP